MSPMPRLFHQRDYQIVGAALRMGDNPVAAYEAVVEVFSERVLDAMWRQAADDAARVDALDQTQAPKT